MWTAHHWQHWLARGTFPDHGWRPLPRAQRAHAEGASRSRRAARRWRPRRPRCPRRRAATATGTTATRGSGTRRSRCGRCYALGFDWEANDFFWFIADIAERDEELQVVYGVDGERSLEEQELDHLTGYDHARPVRIGNAAVHTSGRTTSGAAVLDSFYLHMKSRDRLDDRLWPIIRRQVDVRAAALARIRTTASGRSGASPTTTRCRR